jgi:hypothetical protein
LRGKLDLLGFVEIYICGNAYTKVGKKFHQNAEILHLKAFPDLGFPVL